MSEFTPVAKAEDIDVNTAERVMVGDIPVAIIHTHDGFHALTDVCSHAEVALSEGIVEDNLIECFLHGSAFDVTTGVPVNLPATCPVDVWDVQIDDSGTISVRPTNKEKS